MCGLHYGAGGVPPPEPLLIREPLLDYRVWGDFPTLALRRLGLTLWGRWGVPTKRRHRRKGSGNLGSLKKLKCFSKIHTHTTSDSLGSKTI